MLLQNDKIMNRLNRNKNIYHLKESLLDSSMKDLLSSNQKSPSNSHTPQITRTPNQTSITDFSHIPKVNIENIPGELTLATFRNLILIELKDYMKEELNKEEILIKRLVETIKNLKITSFKQQEPIQSQSFTSNSDENNYILTASLVNYKKINLDNTNMNTSTITSNNTVG